MDAIKNSISDIAKMINRHPVDTFRKRGREKVSKLAVLPRKPSKKVTENPYKYKLITS